MLSVLKDIAPTKILLILDVSFIFKFELKFLKPLNTNKYVAFHGILSHTKVLC